MNPIIDALLTADSEGYLKPSHVQMPQAAELVKHGLATTEVQGGFHWERLTPAGRFVAAILREEIARSSPAYAR